MAARRARRDRVAPRVSVVVPTRNEASNLPLVFSRLPHDLHEIIVVDGRSTDGTVEVARTLRPDVRIIRQTGKGKGDALALGFLHATGDIIVTLDADGSADAAEIPRFVAVLVAGADFAKGSRFLQGGGSADITAIRSLGNKALCAVANHAYGAHFTDLCYGYNAFWVDCIDFLSSPWPWFGGDDAADYGTGFEVETVINVRSVKGGLVVWEVPSYECRRLHGSSNLHAVRDGLRIVRTLWRESPGRASRRARPSGCPTGMLEGILPTAPVETSLGGPSQPWAVIPKPRGAEFVPLVAIPPEEPFEPASGAEHVH
ncbi:glycosyltransferase family 2 protein [Nocardioides gansuensis]|uniref:Glycosyltransferase family 2 protein n=1 Tax=Nocardioides gansuensis TaxID=2138300 RepID=A0A2T8FBI4_9ACTN|nr:glycosyltransferase family 2 protein [Nocardioides gansuensis]PVG83055.1 glycosyltransferase family 2 protein [Nocardioides gansuensis]